MKKKPTLFSTLFDVSSFKFYRFMAISAGVIGCIYNFFLDGLEGRFYTHYKTLLLINFGFGLFFFSLMIVSLIYQHQIRSKNK